MGLTESASTLDDLEEKDANDCQRLLTERTYVESCAATSFRQYPDTAMLDIPRSAQVVTRDLMDDQRAWPSATLRRVSGIQVSGRR